MCRAAGGRPDRQDLMKRFIADLHIHTCLSPCAEVDMTPLRIINRAIEQGLDMIAISDHNSAENIEVAVKIAGEKGIALLPAMEVSSAEEAHVLALFRCAEDAKHMQEVVYGSLPRAGGAGSADYQVVVNEHDEVMAFNTKPLIAATGLGLSVLLQEIRALGGLAVASHVDREAFSVIGQLGFIPPDVRFDAFEVVRPDRAGALLGQYEGVPVLCASDAHRLEDIGARTTEFRMQEATFDEVGKALHGEGGRTVRASTG